MGSEKPTTCVLGPAFAVGVWLTSSVAALSPNAARADDPPTTGKSADSQPDLSDEERKIYGTWRVISINLDENTPFIKHYYNFSRERVTVWHPNSTIVDTFEGRPVIDGASKPKRLDLISTGGGQTIIFPGIYEWDGDKLKWCYVAGEVLTSDKRSRAKIETARPKVFKVAAQGPLRRNTIYIFERVTEAIEVPKSTEKQ